MEKIFRVALTTLLLAAAYPAAAAVLWFGGEDTSGLTITGSPLARFNSSGSCWDSNFSRGAFSVANSTGTNDPPTNFGALPTLSSPVSLLWIHATVCPVNNVTSTANQQALIVRSPDGVGRVMLRQTGTTGQLKLSIANAARSFTDLATATGNLAVSAQTIDFKVAPGAVTRRSTLLRSW